MEYNSNKNPINKKLNKVSDNLINVCNEILTKKEKDCQCFETGNNYPSKDFFNCIKKNVILSVKTTINVKNYFLHLCLEL